MPSLLLTIFILQLLSVLYTALGTQVIQPLLWRLYLLLPTPTSALHAQHASQTRTFLKLQSEIRATSAQDAFAKWAKMTRQRDALADKLDATKTSLQRHEAAFGTGAMALRYALTTIPIFALQFYHTKTPAFWLPSGWAPGYVEWVLALPRAPTGAISVQIWGLACRSMLTLVMEAVVGVWGLEVLSRKKEREKVRVKVEGKKEL